MSRHGQWWVAVGLMGISAFGAGDGISKAQSNPTGVIVDATRLDLRRARFPRLLDPDGVVVYPTDKLCRNPKYQGFEGYKPSLDAALKDEERVGKQPLVIVPVQVADDPTGGSVDITAEDADRLRDLNERLELLDKDRVAIVIGLAVIEQRPASGARDVAPDAALEFVFSKPVRPESLEPSDALVVTTDEGVRVDGTRRYDAALRKLVFVPAAPWQAGRTYRVTLSGKIEAEIRATLEVDLVFAFTVKATDSDGRKPEQQPGEGGG